VFTSDDELSLCDRSCSCAAIACSAPDEALYYPQRREHYIWCVGSEHEVWYACLQAGTRPVHFQPAPGEVVRVVRFLWTVWSSVRGWQTSWKWTCLTGWTSAGHVNLFFQPSHVGHIALSGRTSLSPYLVSSFVFWGHSGSPTRQITALGGYTSWLWGVNQPVVLTPSLHEQTCLIVFWLDSRLFWIWTVSVKLGCNFARTSQFCTVSRWFEGSFWITLQVFWRFNHDDSLRINNAQARDGIVEILLRVWFTIDLKAPTRRIKFTLLCSFASCFRVFAFVSHRFTQFLICQMTRYIYKTSN
jgi:hypothetical protein